jgi:DNA-binding transcriptional ArsR family regulator
VSHIVTELGVSQPTVSKHLKVLREAELVTVREEGQHRYYSLSPAPLDAVDDWLVPFLDEDLVPAPAGASTLPEPAVAAADLVGRAAASAKHAWDTAFKRFPGR